LRINDAIIIGEGEKDRNIYRLFAKIFFTTAICGKISFPKRQIHRKSFRTEGLKSLSRRKTKKTEGPGAGFPGKKAPGSVQVVVLGRGVPQHVVCVGIPCIYAENRAKKR
jgi:hypothetical protein